MGKKAKSEGSEKKGGYDESKDVELHAIGEFEEGDTVLGVSVRAYGEGEPKVAITRSITTKSGETRQTKLGRILPASCRALAALLVKAAEESEA